MQTLVGIICANIQPMVNSVGLIFDIFGAFLVATEVVSQFNEKKFKDTPTGPWTNAGETIMGVRAEETDEYKGWERRKYRRMKVGLGFLVLGFLLQILSNWVTTRV